MFARSHIRRGRSPLRNAASAILLGSLSLTIAGCSAGTRSGKAAGGADQLSVPVEHYTLPNGLRVVLSRDTTAPTVGVGVYYHIGFRNEPKERTGFAHLLST